MKICIDPGHGMSNRKRGVYDTGATHTEDGYKYEEASIALRYGLTLKDVLRARQVEVYLTRDDADDHTPVGSRAQMAKDAGCTVFVSLHLNDVEDDSANGLEVLYRDANDKKLAESLQSALIKVTKLRDRGVKVRTDLAVLKFQGVAVLIELGFIGNDTDRERLLNSQVRESVCRAIADVVINHKP